MPERNPAEEGGKQERRRIDLSVAQVAASALATVVGALLASELGVYGTIMGAAVVSVGATTGGAVFQHLFKRTGEQLREVVDRGPNQTANTLRQVPVESAESAPVSADPSAISSEWNAPQVVRARRRWTWKTYAAVSGLVFLLAMTPIVVFELATGQPVSATVKGESGNGTSFGGKVTPKSSTPQDAPSERPSTGGGGRGPDSTPSGGASAPATTRPSREPSATPSGGTGEHGGGASPSAGPSATPSAGASPSAGGGRPTGETTPQPPVPSNVLPDNAPAHEPVAPPRATGTP
ncbi:hypothetical protein [Streptomyces sp. FH025]|uniref:hypothetical protein n=1 Tax=Streptomyces sp. FH025 TaxID=2815937 RepID=UPI001A9D7AE0|nr:hypothetical protein [Streptomyces sp. FH025]MBO1415583.1 hypothetical protein [Streptomyces sp. FH025]